MAAILVRFSWSSCCVINSNDDYGNGVANRFVAEAGALGIRFLARVTLQEAGAGPVGIANSLQIIATSGCKIIVSITDFGIIPNVTAKAKEMGLFGRDSGFTWLFPEAATPAMTTDDFLGSFATNPLEGKSESPSYRKFLQVSRLNLGVEPVLYSSFLWDTVQVYARAVLQLVTSGANILDSAALNEAIKQIKFEGASGPVSFDSNQDRLGGSFAILNYQKQDTQSSGSLLTVGRWSEFDGLSIDTSPMFFDGSSTVPSDIEITAIKSSSAPAIIVLMGSLIALFLIAVATPIALVKEYRLKNRLIIRSSPLFLSVILLGLALSVLGIFFWFGMPRPLLCHMRVWLPFLGCGIAYAALLIKNFHLWYLFNEPSLRVIVIGKRKLLSILGGVISPVILLLILWSSVSPFIVEGQENQSRSVRYLICRSETDKIFAPILFIYMGILVRLNKHTNRKKKTGTMNRYHSDNPTLCALPVRSWSHRFLENTDLAGFLSRELLDRIGNLQSSICKLCWYSCGLHSLF